MSTLREWSLSKLVNHQPHPFQSYCTACERNENSEWIASRERYECELCQRDWESEHAEEIEFQAAAE